MRRPPAALLAAGGGVLWGLCFASYATWWLPWVALVPLFLLLDERRAGRWGWLHGLVSWLVSVYWIAPTLRTYGDLPWAVALPLLSLLAAYLGAYHALFAWLGAPLWRRRGWVAIAALPALWVGLEWLRGHLISGAPWNPAAHAWIAVPGALPLAAWIGAYGISFLVVLANALVARGLTARRWEVAALGILIPLLPLATGARWGAGPEPPASDSQAVTILQPNIPNLVTWDQNEVARNYQKLLKQSREACAVRPGLIIWPESAAWPFALERDPMLARDTEELAARGCPVLLNSPHWEGERVFNSAYLVAGEQESGRYDKRHLVPYGEYVPLKDAVPFIGKLARNAGDFSAAREINLLQWGRERIGAAICFEVVFPEEVAGLARSGASVLVTITNDAWYGDTSAPWQHFRAAQFRAAENRRPLLRAAITGISGVIAPDGSVRGLLGVGEEGVLRALVTGRGNLSPYARAPSLPPLVCSLFALFAIVWIRFGARR